MVDRLRAEDYLSLTEKPSQMLHPFDVGASTRLDLLWVNQNDTFKSSKGVYFNNPTFRQALARADFWLKKTPPSQLLMVDVAAARALRIYPIPYLERQSNLATRAADEDSILRTD